MPSHMTADTQAPSTLYSSGQTSVTGSGKTQEEARASVENTIAARGYTSHRVTNTKFSKDSFQHHCTLTFTYERK